jgi:hypothetical protein
MSNVSNTIWETCKTYLFTQGRFLAILWVLIAACMVYYFKVLQGNTMNHVVVILLASILGILGSYGVAWFGIRINTTSNSRTAFSALKGDPLATLGIPLRSGMSVGLLLVAVELFFMICILMFLPRELIGPCFIGFAIGESLGASVLRICGGIFTKIADIGSDLMKIVFQVKEDDPRVLAVVKWIGRNYDLKSHPGQGQSGLYYYYHTFAKALDAFGHDVIEDDKGQKHAWRKDLVEELANRQGSDGSWINENRQFFEGDANLCTSFALLALSYVIPHKAN